MFNFNDKRSSNFLEHRIVPRRETSEEVLYKVLDRDKFFAKKYTGLKNHSNFLDISTTGCALRCDHTVDKGSYMEIEFSRLSDQVGFKKPVVVSCETVYCLPLEDNFFRVGAKFLQITMEDMNAIRAFSEAPVPDASA
jgi:hypothetical protein